MGNVECFIFAMSKIKPPVLEKGGTIGVPAPASKPSPAGIAVGTERLKKLGFKVVLGKCSRRTLREGYLAASDMERADELNGMFRDENIHAIICAGGGYGCLRIVEHLDYDLIRDHPKIFMGMSDIVTALLAINKMTGLVTFHGPGVLSSAMSHYTEQSIVRSLTSTDPIGEVRNPPHGPQIETICPGRVEGELTGGNLDLVSATLATKYEIDMRGKIFFFEAAGHRTWEIDRFLTHLELTGKLRSAVGFVAGPMKNVNPAERAHLEQPSPGAHPDSLLDFSFSSTVEEVLQERLGPIGVPAIYGVCCGHTEDQTVLPIGVNAEIDGTEGTLKILETAFSH